MRNMLKLARVFLTGALMRTESPGHHYHSDYPDIDNEHWPKTIVARPINGGTEYYTIPVEFPYLAPEEVGRQ